MTGRSSPAPGTLTRLFLRNTAANLALRGASVVASLVATAALVHGYGEDRFAVIVLGLHLAGLASLAAPGLPGALTREVAAAVGRGARGDAGRLVRAAGRLYLLGGLLLGSALAAFALLGGMRLFRFPPGTYREGTTVLALAGAVLAARWAFAAFGDALAGLQEYPYLAAVRSAVALGVSAGVALAAWRGLPLAVVPGIHALARVVEGLLLRARARRLLPPPPVPPGKTLRTLRPVFRIGAEMAVLEVAGVVHHRVDTLVLAVLASAPAVAACQVTVRLHNLVREFQGTLASALAPLVARESGRGNEAAVEQVLYRGTRYDLVVLLPVVIPAVLFAGDFLRLWLGPEWARWGPLAAAFAGYWGVAALTTFAGQVAVGTANVRPLAAIAAGTAVVNLALSIVLAPRHGVAGVLGATLVAYGLALPLQAIFLFPRLGIRPGRFLREVILPVYPAALALAVTLALLRRVVPPPAGFPALVFQGSIAGFVVLAVLARVALEPRDRQRLRAFLRGRREEAR